MGFMASNGAVFELEKLNPENVKLFNDQSLRIIKESFAFFLEDIPKSLSLLA